MIGVKEPRKAVVESDLVVTSGPILKHPTPTIQKDWLRPGAFGSAVDFDSDGQQRHSHRSTSSPPTITRSFNTIGKPAIFKPRPIRTQTSASSLSDLKPDVTVVTSERWP